MKALVSVIIALSISSPTSAGAGTSCIRQSMENHDYCGPEGRKITYLIPDRAFGEFVSACAAHDVCYSFGGEAIVQKMESKYRKSMLSANDQEKSEFKSEFTSLKLLCDGSFYDELDRACHSLTGIEGSRCRTGAALYKKVVGAFADSAFYKAVDSAFTCRTK